jgi:hypothetical protein
MEALEFSAQIEEGVIRLPKEFERYSNTFVRIIILTETLSQLSPKKEKLKDVLLRMADMNVFSQIEDAVEWQKEQRNS